jgi:hypothetical protein
MTIASERPMGTTTPGALIDPEVNERLAARISKDHSEIDAPTARRIIGQTTAFLAAGVRAPDQFLVPSALVDIGWHTWFPHTVDYAEFCQRDASSATCRPPRTRLYPAAPPRPVSEPSPRSRQPDTRSKTTSGQGRKAPAASATRPTCSSSWSRFRLPSGSSWPADGDVDGQTRTGGSVVHQPLNSGVPVLNR